MSPVVDVASVAGREANVGVDNVVVDCTPKGVPADHGLGAINAVKELAADRGRPRADIYEVVVWEDVVSVVRGELYYAYMVDNQAIVIPETMDAVRALSGREPDAEASMRRTDESLGVRGGSWTAPSADGSRKAANPATRTE